MTTPPPRPAPAPSLTPQPWNTGVIGHESPRDIAGGAGALRRLGPGRGPGPAGARSPTRHRRRATHGASRRGSPTSGPSATCSPRSSRPTTRRTPRRSATCSPRTPRSRTRTARSRGAATPSSSGSRGSSRRTSGDDAQPWRPTPCGSSGPTSRSRRARRRSRPGPTPRRVTNRYSVIYARQGGRWLHARIRDEPPDDDPARAAPGTRMDARRVGQRERRRGRFRPPARGRTTATSCSASSTSRSRAASP